MVFIADSFCMATGDACMVNFKNLVDIVNKAAVQHKVIDHKEITTVEEGLKILQCDPVQVVKTLGFTAGGEYVFFVVRGDKRLDFKKVTSILGVNRKMISAIAAEELEGKLNYEAGGLSPLRTNPLIKVYFDKNILDVDIVYCGIGLRNKTLEIKSSDLFKLSEAVISDIVQ
jgi:prolyl-tRNA editing enzyme YbaK/EbsC (Cys-tRNA(Pro) deacylase)